MVEPRTTCSVGETGCFAFACTRSTMHHHQAKRSIEEAWYRATMCFLVGYKYDGGGCRVWDPKRQVVAESRDIVFFEDGLPSPTLNDLPPRPIDKDELVSQPSLDHSIKPTMLCGYYHQSVGLVVAPGEGPWVPVHRTSIPRCLNR